MNLKQMFESLQTEPRVKSLFFVWEAGDEVIEADPLLYYITRLHIVTKLNEIAKQTKQVNVQPLLTGLLKELGSLKPKVPQPFQANYQTVKELLMSNYHQCVEDQVNDDLSKELYVGFLKMMGMFQALDVFDSFKTDPQQAQILKITEDCKTRGLQIKNQYLAKKDYYDKKAETPQEAPKTQAQHPIPTPKQNTPTPQFNGSFGTPTQQSQPKGNFSNVQNLSIAFPTQPLPPVPVNTAKNSEFPQQPSSISPPFVPSSPNYPIFSPTVAQAQASQVIVPSAIVSAPQIELQKPEFNQAFPLHLLNYTSQDQPPLPYDFSGLVQYKNVEGGFQTNSFVLNQGSKFDQMNSFMPALAHIKEAKAAVEQQDLALAYKKAIEAFNAMVEKNSP